MDSNTPPGPDEKLPRRADCVRSLADHLESALFEAELVDDDPDAAVVLLQFALAFGETRRAQALVTRMEVRAVDHPDADRLGAVASRCRALLDREAAAATRNRVVGPDPSADHPTASAAVEPVTPIRSRVRAGFARRGGTHRPSFGWASLTETEGRVAELVAQGLTNRQVADNLYVSRHTVDSHLRQMFRKLAITSRVQLVRLVIESGQPAAAPVRGA